MIVVDAEMSGLNSAVHSIVSIGAVDFADPSRQFYGECRIWKGSVVDPAALAVNGFSRDQITDPSKSDEAALIGDFIAWLKLSSDQTIAGQNPSYDISFLQAAADRAGLEWRFGYRTVDLHSVAWAWMLHKNQEPPTKDGRTKLNLDVILQYVGLPTEPRPHNGLTGAKMEAEAFSRIIHGRGLLSEYDQYPLTQI